MSNLQTGRLRAPVVLAAALVVLLAGSLVLHQSAARAGSTTRPRAAGLTSTTTTVSPSTTATTVAPTTTSTTAPPAPPPPAAPVVPSGKGMWIWQWEYADDGDTPTIVARSLEAGLTHVYVKVGSSVDGFINQDFLDAFLPAAHAAGLRVIGWDFPYLDDPDADIARAVSEINYTTPTGDRLDGFSADVETGSEGVNLSADTALWYGGGLRAAVGPSYLLIATVPRPSGAYQGVYPYPEVVTYFDAIAPMVYWIDVDPGGAVTESIDFLSQYGKPILPIGQAYDGGLEGGPPGTPTYDELSAFIDAASADGAAAVSFWSWQHANDEMWSAIAAGPEVGIRPPG